jgi:hypothetical protein
MDEATIKVMIRGALGPDGKLRCADALRVAEEAGVPAGVVGRLADELEIRIKGCQLGCF